MIDKIKRYFYNSVLKQRAENISTKHKVTNLTDAKSIGIIYDSTNPNHDIAITKFAEMLRAKGKKVEILGYLNDKKIDHKEDIKLFNKNSVNWYGIPNDARVDAFVNQTFDILICALTNENLPLEYISYFSKSTYRVGPFHPQKTDYFDLMINTSEREELSYLLDQIIFFLNKIEY